MNRHLVWASLIVSLIVPAFSQKIPKTPILIRVEDQTGAKIPKAQVEVSTSDGNSVYCDFADDDGKAKLNLPTGKYLWSVHMQGFCPQKASFELLDEQPREITARMKWDTCPGPCEPACVTVIAASTQSRLEVTVEDQSGARVPGAMVQVHANSSRIAEVRTDCSGKAALFLNSGKYTILVRGHGFTNYSDEMVFERGVDQAIRAVLKVGQSGSGFPVNTANILEPQRAVADNVSIKYVLLATVPVPAHKLRPWFCHHRAR